MSYIPNTGNKISAANSTTGLLLAAGTFTGAWEDVTNFTTVAVAIIGDNLTDGTLYIESSQDGGVTVNSVPFNVPDTTFDLPHIWNVVEGSIRIRYVNGTTAQTGFFQLQTKYSNGQELGLLQNAGDTITAITDVQIVKSVGTGDDPNGDYVNLPANGVDNGNTTAANLGISGVFTGTWCDVRLYSEIRISYDSDVNGASCFLQFSPDASTVERSIAVPPQANSLQTNFGAVHTLNPILPYFRVVYTNGGAAQTAFSLTTMLAVENGNGLISRATQVINRYNDVKLQRIINSPEQDRNFGLVGYQEAKRKFGYHASVPNSAYETVWMGADIGGAAEAVYDWLTVAETIRIAAGGNAADDTAGAGARIITVEGLDENWEFATEDIVTAGASASSATTTTFIRVNKVFTKEVGTYAGSNTGDIEIEGVSSGTNLAYIAAGIGNTQQSVYSVPAGKTAWITKIKISVGQGNSADVRMFHNDNADDITAPFTSTKHFEWGVEDYSGAAEFNFDTFLKFEEKNDIYFDAKRITGSGTAQVSVDFEFIETNN